MAIVNYNNTHSKQPRQGLCVAISKNGNLSMARPAMEMVGLRKGCSAALSFDDDLKHLYIKIFPEKHIGALTFNVTGKDGANASLHVLGALKFFGCQPPADTIIIRPEWDAKLSLLRIPYPQVLCGRRSAAA